MKNAPDHIASAPPGAEGPSDARTRDRVARLLLEEGPSTAASLSERLGLTPAAIRRHLDALIASGTVVEAPERKVSGAARGRGRPAKRFTLSEAGRAAFPHAYDDLAAAALRFLAEQAGEGAVDAFARARVAGLEDRYGAQLAAVDNPEGRAIALAEALTADGYVASAERAGAGVQLCQHHCPVQHVAEAFPQLCEAETVVFGKLLGTHVQRLATIAHGDGVCTTHVPPVAADPAGQAGSTGKTSTTRTASTTGKTSTTRKASTTSTGRTRSTEKPTPASGRTTS